MTKISHHKVVEVIDDEGFESLEEHFSETVLHLLQNKLGEGSKPKLIPCPNDPIFSYRCLCLFHEDSKNPNGRITTGDEKRGAMFYCNSCDKTWFIQDLLRETGQTSEQLWGEIQSLLPKLQKRIPKLKLENKKIVLAPKQMLGSVELPRFGDLLTPHINSITSETEIFIENSSAENSLVALWNLWEEALDDTHRELLIRIGLDRVEAGFHSARVLDLNHFAEINGKKGLNRFRTENPQLNSTACLVFPLRDRYRMLQTVVFRPIRPEDGLELPKAFFRKEGQQKYFNLAGASRLPYGLPQLEVTPEELVLCEGIRDWQTLRGYQENVLATLGSLTRDQAEIIRRLNPKKILLAYDADPAGRNHTHRAVKLLHELDIKVFDLPDGKDPADLTKEELKPINVLPVEKWMEKYDAAEDEDDKEISDDPDEMGEQQDGIPEDFRIKNGWLEYVDREERKNGKLHRTWVRLCSELQVVASVRGFNSDNWGMQLRFKDRERNPHEWVMPAELMAGEGNDIQKELLNRGLRINTGRTARQKLVEFLNHSEPGRLARCVDRVGWHGRQFVLPNGEVIGPDHEEPLLLMERFTIKTAFKICGSLEEWQEHVALPCKENSRLLFALSASFAAALLEPLVMESGGFNFRGDSSQGKTALLDVAGSVWGGGMMNGYKRTWRNTSNALESVAQAHCDTLLCLDEMGQVDAKEAGQVSYMLANGSGKGRSRAEGGLREQPEWRVLFLSTGELSLGEHMLSQGTRIKAGQEVRLVDIPGDAGKGLGCWEEVPEGLTPAGFTQHLKSVSMKYYGTAIRRFLELMSEDTHRCFMRDGFEQSRRKLEPVHLPEDADGQVQRVFQRFILVGHAGELAISMGILPFTPDACMNAAMQCCDGWLTNRGTSGSREVDEGLRKVRLFLETNQDSRFTPYTDILMTDQRPTYQRAGYTHEEDGETYFLIQSEVFRQDMLKGFDATLIGRSLRDLGLLKPGDGKNLARKTSDGKKRFYWVSNRVLEDYE
ncbi:MAG: DUF927 domain-containing protein [SAR324 cluster bacterium]|nr:DUF927 domain-containing protein [SAR324 cluster bacterium]